MISGLVLKKWKDKGMDTANWLMSSGRLGKVGNSDTTSELAITKLLKSCKMGLHSPVMK
jgi:hypothetical protein